ncbi:MAG: biotin/lipoyl-binding protein [[Lactobacillus] timonensis]|jgi:HlyD family secretion protein|nr:biotin/lipoyl-binding protein [[Lactobacillus] timonensis]
MKEKDNKGRSQRLRRLTHSRHRWWYLAIAILVVVGLVTYVVGKRQASNHQKPRYRTSRAVAQGSFNISGKIQPTQTQVLTLPDGKLQSLRVKNGDHVTRGQALLTVTNQESKDNALSIQGDVSKSQQDLQNQQQTINQLNQQLGQMNSTDDGYADLQSQLSQARAAYQDAQSSLSLSQSRLNEANNQAQQILVAPYDGYVTVDTSKSSEPVVTIYSDTLQFAGKVSEYDYAKVHQGETLKVRALATHHSQKAPITFISRVPTKASGNNSQYELTANVDEKKFIDGQTAKAALFQDGVQIPKSAVIDHHVFIKDGNHYRKVRVSGHAENSFFIVSNGVDDGDQVVVNPDRHLKNGTRTDVK